MVKFTEKKANPDNWGVGGSTDRSFVVSETAREIGKHVEQVFGGVVQLSQGQLYELDMLFNNEMLTPNDILGVESDVLLPLLTEFAAADEPGAKKAVTAKIIAAVKQAVFAPQ